VRQPEALRRLLQPTDDEAGWYRDVEALDPDQAVPFLAAVLSDRREPNRTRLMAALTLGVLGDPRALDPLARALRASDPVLRAQAARALGRLRQPEAARHLVGMLRDDDAHVRETAAGALGRLGAPEAVPALREMAGDPVAVNREAAARALAAIEEVT
jgi:HEAT repeat protein